MEKIVTINIDTESREIGFSFEGEMIHEFQEYSPQSPLAKVVALLAQLLRAEVYNK